MRPPCVFCQDGFKKAGKILKCLHKICMECLPASVQEDGRIRCAKCRRTTACPPPGRCHEDLLVDDSMFDRIPSSHEEAKVQDARCDDDMSLFASGEEAPGTQALRSSSSDAVGCQKQKPRQCARSHLCPFHSGMEMRYFCTHCRQVLCEKCKHESDHASHEDEFTDIPVAAAALRHKLTEGLKNLEPKDEDKEVDASLQYASDVLEAFDCDLAHQVANIKALIHGLCSEQLRGVKKRENELMIEGKVRTVEQFEFQSHFLIQYHGGISKCVEVRRIIDGVSSNEDLLKIYPYLLKALTDALRSIDVKRYSAMWRARFQCKNFPDWKGPIGVMGKVVDNTGINVSGCRFDEPGGYVGFLGEDDIELSGQIVDWRDQPVTKAALKLSTIKIWASKIQSDRATANPVQLPIIGYSEGEVHALFRYDTIHEAAVFILEVQLDKPSPIPTLLRESLHGKWYAKRTPLTTWVFLFQTRSVYFEEAFTDFMGSSPCLSSVSPAYPEVTLYQRKNGLSSVRALQPVLENNFDVAITILACPSKSLEIGFAWDGEGCREEMKVVLATSAEKHSSPDAICSCVAGEILRLQRCPCLLNTYTISKHMKKESDLKTVHLHPTIMPYLMVRMFDTGTMVQILSLFT
eukprot:scpid44402/ scgid20353/ Tripartite motif-containing protein 2; E3 ubiquitin-protein ligase TRIM2; Neural activity-related RING finger protein